VDSNRRELEQAFLAFNKISDQLQESYGALEQRVAALTQELEVSRRDRKREARNAERLAERLQLLLSTLPAGVIVVDDDGLIQETNPAAAAILGGTRTGESWQGIARQVFRPQLTPSGDWVRQDGRLVSLLVSQLTEDGAKIVLLTDVTDTRALEDLVNRNRRLSAMGEMAASLAHQIRTPLAGALLYLSQCRSRPNAPNRGDLLERGIERLRCLDRLVQDMLVFTRGNGPGERVRVADLFRVVDESVRAIKPPQSHLIINGTDVLVEIEGNLTALTAALTNLISNAFESGPDIVVTLQAAVRGSRIGITVHDNGPGIALEIQSRVFEPFFSTRPAGTGLGLAVVKTVAEAHGGELELESTPESGTTIGLDLPRERPASEPLARDVA
jgi:two-component system sensor histidine kinase FlrB